MNLMQGIILNLGYWYWHKISVLVLVSDVSGTLAVAKTKMTSHPTHHHQHHHHTGIVLQTWKHIKAENQY